MAAQYSEEQITEYEESRQRWLDRGDALLTTILTQTFANPQAGEYARTGFARRLGYLDHAMLRLDEVYPPNIVNAPRDRVRDAELILQAFVMNVFGAIDNLAWVWALERNVTGPGGRALYGSEMVFVGPRCDHLIASLTPPILDEIANAAEWFDVIGAYRHGVAHQIPIYIPRLFSEDESAEFGRLEFAIRDAFAADDLDAALELMDRKHGLGDYGAMMALNGERRPMLLHPQLVCDLATVVNLGETIFGELSAN
jgi:hypothetical protein